MARRPKYDQPVDQGPITLWLTESQMQGWKELNMSNEQKADYLRQCIMDITGVHVEAAELESKGKEMIKQARELKAAQDVKKVGVDKVADQLYAEAKKSGVDKRAPKLQEAWLTSRSNEDGAVTKEVLRRLADG